MVQLLCSMYIPTITSDEKVPRACLYLTEHIVLTVVTNLFFVERSILPMTNLTKRCIVELTKPSLEKVS